MVSGRRLDYGTANGNPSKQNVAPKHRDLESGSGLRQAKFKFRDAVFRAVEGDHAHEFKKKLKEGIDRNALEKFRKSQDELKQIKNKEVRKFYEDQNQRLSDWLEVDSLVMSMADDVLDSMNPVDLDHDGFAETGGALQREHESIEPLLPEDERQRRIKGRRKAKWAININVIANILLLIAKIIAAFYSSSLSLIASLVDSALDLLCTLIVWSTNQLVKWKLARLKAKFPVGRRRLEPLGILVFSILMIVSFLQILQESVTKLLPGGEKSAVALPAIAIGAMASTIGIKGIIWIGCIPIKTTQVQALAQDCKTDVIFNTLSLLFPIIGSKTDTWWLDPLGAALLSLFIIYDWAETCVSNVTKLTGAAADEDLLRKITFLAYRFSPLVKAYKSIKAYHAGDGVWVEVDLLADGETPLKRVHDVAETLQYCLEGLNEVDRAFVTVDYTSQGPTGHNSEQ